MDADIPLSGKVNILAELFVNTFTGVNKLDYTPESLLDVETWIRTEWRTKQPNHMAISQIACYLGEVVVKSVPNINWGDSDDPDTATLVISGTASGMLEIAFCPVYRVTKFLKSKSDADSLYTWFHFVRDVAAGKTRIDFNQEYLRNRNVDRKKA